MTERRKTTTFDFGDGHIEDSTFSEIDSSADRVAVAGKSRGSLYRRVRHEPFRTRDGVNWERIEAIVGIAVLIVTVVFGLIAIL